MGGLTNSMSPMIHKDTRNPDMVAEQSSDLRPRDQSASQPVQHSVCQWSVQTLLMCAIRSKAMITSMSSSAQKHRDSGNTVAVQAGVQHGQDGRRRQGADKRDAGGTEQSVSAKCQASDDCVGNLCGSRVTCRDKMTPTSIHLNGHTL